jgi:hypothetical protein
MYRVGSPICAVKSIISDGWSTDGKHPDRAREHRGSAAGLLLGHLGSGRPRRSDGSVAAVRHDDVAGDVDG